MSITREAFASLDDQALVWACIGPAVAPVRGKDPDAKFRAFAELDEGQRALFLFQVFYGHMGRGVWAFFQQIGYLLPHFDLWTGLEKALRRFGDEDTAALVGEIKLMYGEICMGHEIPRREDGINAHYRELAPQALARAAAYVRGHAGEFVRFKEGRENQ